MTQNEFLTLLISVSAILLSIYALIQNHRIARKQYELDLKQSNYSRNCSVVSSISGSSL